MPCNFITQIADQIAGNINSASITQTNTVSLVNQIVTGLYLRSGSCIDAFEFQITDTISNKNTLAPR
jgi:hypothetical protein